ncbi:DNA polymerase IV [Thalassotalea ponticola]|uniref:DNA polymerase IV n=1 Tax=Thalassotalea ponticola TaxID=1523392 RepID=UPI0025B535E4|nr:DNA polymerase IV [Thalassotalea ponticola]MDN3653847.1 DNA polymerase IV [Thalassotalea ponticola]
MRKIIHIDMDCFFAAVEARDDESLRNIPIAIAGRSERSVVSTCNYIAREYGVRSAMSVKRALQLCPHLTLVASRMSVYQQVSEQLRSIFYRYTELVEPLSLDEAYLDVTDSQQCGGSATLIAQQIRRDIQNELSLTASAGIATNKFLAKIASDENKPNGQYVIAPADVSQFVEQLPLAKIPGVGPKTLTKLQRHGLQTCADVRACEVKQLTRLFGKFGMSLYQRAHGIDESPVQPSRERKSLALETTLMDDISGLSECLSAVNQLIPKFEQRLSRVTHRQIKSQGVKVKFNDFSQTTVENTTHVLDKAMLAEQLERALARGSGKKVRLLGLHVMFKSVDRATDTKPQLSLDLS